MKEVYVTFYTDMRGRSSVLMVYEDERDAAEFCNGHQCYSYQRLLVIERKDRNADSQAVHVPLWDPS